MRRLNSSLIPHLTHLRNWVLQCHGVWCDSPASPVTQVGEEHRSASDSSWGPRQVLIALGTAHMHAFKCAALVLGGVQCTLLIQKETTLKEPHPTWDAQLGPWEQMAPSLVTMVGQGVYKHVKEWNSESCTASKGFLWNSRKAGYGRAVLPGSLFAR